MIGIVRLRDREVLEALRCNVRDLQKRLDRTKRHAGNESRAREKYKQQLLLDRVYTDRLKAAAWAVVEASKNESYATVDAHIDRLELALQGREP